jgi:hypothetical protein
VEIISIGIFLVVSTGMRVIIQEAARSNTESNSAQSAVFDICNFEKIKFEGKSSKLTRFTQGLS